MLLLYVGYVGVVNIFEVCLYYSSSVIDNKGNITWSMNGETSELAGGEDVTLLIYPATPS